MTQDKQVIIIGAGIAGLKAASQLYANGIKNCLVVEARDRLGGRLQTVSGYNCSKYDLGAAWHHDILMNGLFTEELELNKKCKDSESKRFVFDDNQPIFVDEERGRLDHDPEMILEFIDKEIDKYTELEFYQSLDVKDCSFHDIILKYLFERRDTLTDDQIRYSAQICRYLELWHGIGWKDMSAKGTYFDHQGRNALVTNFDSIIERISSSFPKEWIVLNTEVKTIERKGKIVVVKLNNGEEYTCEYTVVTVPQSVLELSTKDPNDITNTKGRIEFIPPLNARIQEAFRKMHFGGLGKVIFEFDACCWTKKGSRIFTLAHSKETFVNNVREAGSWDELIKKSESVNSTDKPKDLTCWDYPLLFVDLAKSTDVPTLVMLMQRPLSNYIESIGDDKQRIFEFFQPVLDKIMSTLDTESVINEMFGATTASNKIGPKLKNIMTTNWSIDPYSRGSYSTCFPEDDALEMIIAMSSGQDSRIRFAGEHTIMDGAGAVHGSWESGKREAAYISKNLYNK
ncbi:polyamine oxidase NDAI_0B01530 [Naumovozyma dairenensis CBS 421]|uniref:Amine oxidase domain-containing protein n=1 Tax=Naumovozyma dairenensis (strain ATCC 10597 / BCRC 20456 / CBS 421 / NBRC 0211 / NRRL Y-12639) TaxID=1071378 RepID=G0W5X6_NAUDC|nr:hypothetical protein NDAI_0B01530 [Naumovozyma dairenensis CBS 421]CCD23187.1 hypothetical protein NDAI_0B01530 [Naumovozyma dairenensis CBS 421]